MQYTHIVWDWNGTLFDDLEYSLKCINTLLARYGLENLTVSRYHDVFGFPISEYYKRIGFDFDKVPYSVLAKEYMDIYIPGSMHCPLRSDAQQTVDRLNENGYVNIVLSASKEGYLLQQAEAAGLKNIYKYYGIDNIHAAGKEDIARKLREDLKDASVLFVGDTVHDKAAATAAGADCIFVGGGHNGAEKLKDHGLVFDSLKQVADWLLK